jgi:hypothetical protein
MKPSTPSSSHHLSWAAVSLLTAAAIAIPGRASAQDRVALTVAAGGIFGTDPPPAVNVAAPAISASVQRVWRQHFVLEGSASYWEETTRRERGPYDVQGPSGVIGRIGRTTVLSEDKDFTLGLAFLVRSTGAVRLFGGAGAALITANKTSTQSHADCQIPSQPRACDGYVDRRTQGPLPLFRLIGGVEVPVSARLAIVALVRADTITWEGRTGMVSAMTGVRFALK